jgi:hypothetical protein
MERMRGKRTSRSLQPILRKRAALAGKKRTRSFEGLPGIRMGKKRTTRLV